MREDSFMHELKNAIAREHSMKIVEFKRRWRRF